jgi:hypothetical protein
MRMIYVVMTGDRATTATFPLILEFTIEICGFESQNSRYDVLYRDVALRPCYAKGKCLKQSLSTI